MIPKNIVSQILWATIEDFVGLWEILWELNSLEIENNKNVGIQILNYLLKNKLIKFYFSIWGEDELIEMSEQDSFEIMLNDKYWEAPAIGQKCIKIGSTEYGETIYYNNQLEDLMLS